MATQQAQVLHLVPSPREKKPERKRKNLIRLGIDHGMAYAWSRTRMGGWAVAQSPILRTTITLVRMKSRRDVQWSCLHFICVCAEVGYDAGARQINVPAPQL